MPSLRSRTVSVAVLALFAAVSAPAAAVESHTYQGDSGYTATFPLAGGQYSLYVNAHFAHTGKTHAPDSCTFVANLQRVSPSPDTTQFGGPVPITGPAHFNIGPMPVMLPAGRYALYVASQTDCMWTFSLEASTPKPAGIDAVRMYKKTDGAVVSTDSIAIDQDVQFSVQYGLGKAQHAPSGELQIVHAGSVIARFPLLVGTDPVTNAPALYAAMHFDQGDARYAGSNLARLVVTIGGTQYNGTKQFTLTP